MVRFPLTIGRNLLPLGTDELEVIDMADMDMAGEGAERTTELVTHRYWTCKDQAHQRIASIAAVL
jgi:hypothetical protein